MNKKKYNLSIKDSKKYGYSLLKIIGEGAYGKVYLAKTQNELSVAIKTVEFDCDQVYEEIKLLKSINHPNCIKILDYFETMDQQQTIWVNMVMEYFPFSLYSLIYQFSSQNKIFPMFYLKLFIFQLFSGLAHIHKLGIVHRDIKPENILINPTNGRLVICDFGLSKKIRKGEENSSYIASRYYRAPELLLGSTDYGESIDIWSVGCVIAEILRNGIPLFAADTIELHLDIIYKVIGSIDQKKYKKPLGLEKMLIRNCPPDLLDLLSKILSFDPKLRLTAKNCLKHKFFDELFEKGVTLPNGNNLPILNRFF